MLSKTGRLGTFSVLARETCRSRRMTPLLVLSLGPHLPFPWVHQF